MMRSSAFIKQKIFKTITNQRLGFLVVILLSLFAHRLMAQDSEEYKVKKVKPSDFIAGVEMVKPEDHALYIFNIGDSYVEYFSGNRPDLHYSQHYRIRILDEEGLGHANVSIPLKVGSDETEKIISLKGGVYNMVDAEVVFERLKNDDWSVVKKDNNTETIHISFKGVKVGSIIELEFVLGNPFFVRPRDWDFQLDDAPVLYSKYSFSHPVGLTYKLILRDGLNVVREPVINAVALGVSSSWVGRPNYDKKRFTFIAGDVPAMRREPFMNSIENYRSSLLTELESIDVDAASRYFYYPDWNSATQDFIANGNNSSFIYPADVPEYYKSPSFGTSDTLAIVTDVYNHISAIYTESNSANYLSANRSMQAIWKYPHATNNEINWLLLSILKVNGVEAFPVLYSERNSPMVREDVPIFTQFDDLMVVVPTGGENLLLDASNATLALGEISEWSCNGNGLVVDPINPRWIEMKGKYESSQTCAVEFDKFEGGVLSGKMNLTFSGIYANRMIRFLQNNGLDNMNMALKLNDKVKYTLKETPALKPSQPFVLKFEVSYRPEVKDGNYVLAPILFDPKLTNPFQADERMNPVNYPSPWSESYTCLIRLDQEKYDVVLPESIQYALPNSDGAFMFSASYAMGNLVIRSKMDVNKTTFMPSEYGVLKTMYQDVSDSHGAVIEVKGK